MCGFIAGQSSKPWDKLVIQQGINQIFHRGPDSQNILIKNDLMMAHTRLSIVGISNGSQPIENYGIHIVVNGEFYQHNKIKEDLKIKGFKFKTESDSEILIYLYLLYGFECLEYLEGEFSFVLYDSRKNLWFCARDRFGVRPLVWHKKHDTILFASEVKALQPFIPLKLDKDSLWFSQHFQYLPQGKTLFENINMLKPSYFLFVQNGNIKEINYWQPPTENTKDDIFTVMETTDYLLKEAVSKRIPREVMACAHLSGGIDSSSISQIASQYGVKDCFTISFTDDGFYNEVELAQLTANKIGTDLHVIEVGISDIIKNIPKAIYHAEGLSINGHLSGKYLLNQSIHNAGFKVAFSGEGADEIFMGYSHLKQDYLSSNSLSTIEKSYLNGVQLPSGQTMPLDDIEAHLGFLPTWLKAKSSIAYKLAPMWTHDFYNKTSPNKKFISEMKLPAYSQLKKSSFLWAQYCLASYILKVLDDAQSMAFSVEGRLPFLDTELVNYVWSFPDEYYFNGNIEKHILRTIMKDKLPKEIIDKTKQSFMSPPITRALKQKKEKDFIYENLFNSYFLNQNIFDKTQIEKQLKNWELDPSPESEPILMTLLSISSICKGFKLND